MKLIIDIPEQMYQNAKADTLCGADIIVKAIKNGIPHETVTEFADRCRECGAKYGKLLEQEPKIGNWSHDGSHWKNRFICSGCGYKLFDEPTNYCPNCGAKMVEPQESEDKE